MFNKQNDAFVNRICKNWLFAPFKSSGGYQHLLVTADNSRGCYRFAGGKEDKALRNFTMILFCDLLKSSKRNDAISLSKMCAIWKSWEQYHGILKRLASAKDLIRLLLI